MVATGLTYRVAPVDVQGPPAYPATEPQGAVTEVDQPGNRTVRENESSGHPQADQVRLEPAVLPLDDGWRTAATGRREGLERWYTGMGWPVASSTPTVGTPRNEQAVPEVLWNNTAPAGADGDLPRVYSSTELEICDGVHATTGAFWATVP